MSKIFEWDARKGSYLCSNGKSVSFGNYRKFQKTRYGISAHAYGNRSSQQNGQVVVPLNVYNDTSKPFSFTFITYHTSISRELVFFSHNSGGNYLSISSNVFYLTSGTNAIVQTGYIRVSFPTLTDKNLWCITVNYDGSKKARGVTILINGLKITTSIVVDIMIDNVIAQEKFFLGNGFGVEQNLNDQYYFRWDDSLLTLKQHQDIYANFLQSTPIQYPIVFNTNLNVFKSTEIKDQGLIAAYNFQPVGNKLINIAWDNPANGYNARQYDCTIPSRFSILSDSIYRVWDIVNPYALGIKTNNKINITNYECTIQITTKVKHAGWNGLGVLVSIGNAFGIQFYNDGTNPGGSYIKFNGNPYYFAGNFKDIISTFQIIYQRGTLISIYNGNKQILATSLSNIILNDYLTILGTPGSNTVGSVNGNAYDCRIYNRVLSDQEIKNYHNSFASKVVVYEDFKQYAVGSTKFGNWRFKTGLYNISEGKILGNYAKYLNYLSSTGFAILPGQTIAYGTYEFLYNTSNNNSKTYFISEMSDTSKTNSYNFTWISGSIYIQRRLNGVETNIASAIYSIPYGWTKIKITRTTDGNITLYANNIKIISVIDTNVTKSNYFIDYNSGVTRGTIANLKITQGVTA